jgi:glycosyltransferase involved in cell wall biosynthesis
MKINIAYILPKLSKKAPVEYVYSLVLELNSYFNIDIYYFDNVVELEFPCSTRQINIFETIDFNKYDIVHSHGFRPDLYVISRCNSLSTIKISTTHSFIKNDLNSTYNFFISFIFSKIWISKLRKIDYIITLTNCMLKYYSKFIDKNKLFTIYSGHSIDIHNTELDSFDKTIIQEFKRDKILLGVVANLTKQKGISQIINALKYSDKYCLLIIGQGKYQIELEKLAISNNVRHLCLFLGHKTDAYRYIHYFDIFALSSFQEGFGLAGLEAAQLGKPLICSDIEVFREIYPSDIVQFFNLHDPKSLLSAADLIFEKYDFFSNSVKKFYLDNYTKKIMAQNYFHFYKNVILNK